MPATLAALGPGAGEPIPNVGKRRAQGGVSGCGGCSGGRPSPWLPERLPFVQSGSSAGVWAGSSKGISTTTLRSSACVESDSSGSSRTLAKITSKRALRAAPGDLVVEHELVAILNPELVEQDLPDQAVPIPGIVVPVGVGEDALGIGRRELEVMVGFAGSSPTRTSPISGAQAR